MALYRILLRSLRRSYVTTLPLSSSFSATTPHFQTPTHSFIPCRSYAFSSAEEAAAERRRRKRRLRIEPPLDALRRDPNAPRPPRDPNAPRLPDSTSALVGPRLNLHNRVQSLIRAFDLDSASAIARHSVYSNTRPTVFTCNAIMAAMYRAQRFDDAVALFHFFYNQNNIVPNVVSYNVLINTHCDAGRVDVGLEVYRHIIANAPFSPSPVTYRHLTKGLVEAGRIGEGVDLLREMLNKGHGADSLVYSNLIRGFLELENLDKANELFDELKERCLVYDGIVNATYMDWHFKRGQVKEAMESYRSLLDKKFNMTPATCNVLIETLLKHGRETEARAMFETMLDNHKPPNIQAVNSETFNIMVNECFRLGKKTEGLETFKKVGTKVGSKPFMMDVAGFNNIIMRCCENGMVSDAEQLFEELIKKSINPDVTTYKTLIYIYLDQERIDDALQMFRKMADAGLRVIASIGNKVFDALVSNGKAADCVQILTKMGEKDPKPDPMSYEIVLRALCNEGNLDLGRDLLEQMVRYSVGVLPPLRQFVLEVYGGAGRGAEIERLLDMNRWGHAPQYSRSGPPPLQYSRSGPPPPQYPGPGTPPPQYPRSGSPQYQQSSGTPPPQYQQSSGTPPPQYQQSSGTPPPQYQQSSGTPPPQYQQSSGTPPPQYQQSSGTPPPQYQQSSGTPPPLYQQSSGIPPPQYQQSSGTPPPQYQQSSGTPPPLYQQSSGIPPPQYQQSSGTPPPLYQQSSGIPPPQYQQSSGTPPPQYQQSSGTPPLQYQQSSGTPPPQYQQSSGTPPPQYQQSSGIPPHYTGSGPAAQFPRSGPPPTGEQYVHSQNAEPFCVAS